MLSNPVWRQQPVCTRREPREVGLENRERHSSCRSAEALENKRQLAPACLPPRYRSGTEVESNCDFSIEVLGAMAHR